MTHICIGKLTIIGSDNGLSPGRRQAIIWNNARILLIGPLETNFNEILIEIHTFSFKKMHLKMSSGKRRPFCLGLNVLMKMHPGGDELTVKDVSIVSTRPQKPTIRHEPRMNLRIYCNSASVLKCYNHIFHNIYILSCMIYINTLRPRKMDAIFQMTFTNNFLEWKYMNFDWNFIEG